ncbi:hypothetical protein QQZ08_008672 [Neonectria magnoliae]|uniref:DRBM domain-containing protein n=1 Tax=Neonectria magnoliae TaxID=2732573 RepID=A0ABR1HT87_9HYPO
MAQINVPEKITFRRLTTDVRALPVFSDTELLGAHLQEVLKALEVGGWNPRHSTTEVQRPNHHAPEYGEGEPVAIHATVQSKPGPLAPTHPPVTGEGECNTNEIAAAKAADYVWDRLNRNLVDEA